MALPYIRAPFSQCHTANRNTSLKNMLLPPPQGHETGHATGAKHRLDRDLTGRFGSAKYAMDEVINPQVCSLVL